MRIYRLSAVTAAVLTLAPAAHAQNAIEGRVVRLEGEMRAVQRKVFSGGGQYVEPDIAPATSPVAIPGSPSGSPVADLDARVNALESQMSGLTGQIEQSQHRLTQLEDAFAAYRRATDARLKSAESAPAPTDAGADTSADTGKATLAPAEAAALPRPTGARPGAARAGAPVPAAAAAARDPDRAARAAAIEKPVSDDPAEDSYLYGYRLWQARLFPQAEAQLKTTVATYPKHKRASYAQNLLGRSYLDEGKNALAALALYDNYKKMPDGDRASDSLYYLAQALVKLNKPAAEVCKVYDELNEVYGAKVSDEMKARIATGRSESKCK